MKSVAMSLHAPYLVTIMMGLCWNCAVLVSVQMHVDCLKLTEADCFPSLALNFTCSLLDIHGTITVDT